METPRSAAPLPDSNELALLQLLDERLQALAVEKNGLRILRARLVTRIEQEGAGHAKAA